MTEDRSSITRGDRDFARLRRVEAYTAASPVGNRDSLGQS